MPDLSNAASSTQVSYWIGIDGTNTDRVIQAGFDAVKGSDGTVTYTAFYEWFPNPATFVSLSDFTASAGDGEYHGHAAGGQFQMETDDTIQMCPSQSQSSRVVLLQRPPLSTKTPISRTTRPSFTPQTRTLIRQVLTLSR
jgi:hypothetical protein